jgi:arylsulfatase A-like enzyme
MSASVRVSVEGSAGVATHAVDLLFRCRRGSARALPLLAALALLSCGSRPEPAAVPLVDRFSEATVENAVAATEGPPRIEWRFDGETKGTGPAAESPTRGWTAVHDVRGLLIRDGRLVGRVGPLPILAVALPENPDTSDSFHALEIRLRIAKGERLGASFVDEAKLDAKEIVRDAKQSAFAAFNVNLRPGDKLETYTLAAANASFNTSYPLGGIRHVVLRFTGAKGALFEIASMRLVTLKEHLASIPSGVGWQGLADVFRETLVARSPERITFPLDLPSRPYLDLAVGTVDNGPVTFRVEAEVGGVRKELLKRTVSSPNRWHLVPVDLEELGGRRAALSFVLEAEREGTPGFWGTPIVRNRAGRVRAGEPTPARRAVVGERRPPQGVILVIADTLRRDHLQPYGYERANAPVLSRLAREGALFRDTIAQGTWTKVSVSSIITSLYPTTHGIKDMPDRLPAGVTTLAEAYRSAGYATFATSSVPFTGRLTNLHQGVEVLHEATSLPDFDHSQSKTSRTYVDRLLEWIELNREVPFFALLHIFDPHSPFEPYRPYENLWMKPEEVAQHRKDMERAKKFIEEDFFKRQALAKPAELRKAGLDQATYVAAQKAWYDSSIRAMDVEVGRLLERLQELGIADRTLIAFGSDHGEEFLEHGRPFHGHSTYGELLNVPLVLWWPGAIPGGVSVDETVQTIDLMPTMLELSLLPVPERAQGQSLLPLLAGADPATLGWTARPAFAERALAPVAFEREEDEVESWAIVDDGWKLIRNGVRPAGRPEFELYDHRADPLNLHDVAAAHPDVVERLARKLKGWEEQARAARVSPEAGTAEASEEELARLRALGYVQ